MNPLFHTEFSISDSLKNVRKSVLIYETIIGGVSWVAITLSGILLIVGGIFLSYKDKILALSAQFKERRWHNED